LKSIVPILLLFWTSVALGAVPPETDYRKLLKTLETSLLEGNARALRDLGSLLDNPEVRNKARRLINQYTLFSPEEFVIDNPLIRNEFLGFYYEVADSLVYSDLLEVFYLTDPSQHKVSYKITAPEKEQVSDESVLLNQHIQLIEKSLKTSNDSLMLVGVHRIGMLNRSEGYDFLTNLLSTTKIKKSNFLDKVAIYQAIALELEAFVDISVLKNLLNLVGKDQFSLVFSQERLANLTNVHFEASDNKSLVKKYQHLIDSLTTIEEIRAYGYQQLFDTRPIFFTDQVDYYGRILSLSGKYDWIEYNAIRDLCYQEHPRAMYYLAGHLFKIRKKSNKKNRKLAKTIVSKINQLIHLEIQVLNKSEEFSARSYLTRDQVARTNYMMYWAAHYNDYEWDGNREYFVNKNEAIETTQNYERLFRRLNSRNDSVAIVSFIKLTEGEPNEVIALSEKYRQMFRNYNQSLPSFQFKYLEQLSQLTYYCRKNDIAYQPSAAIFRKLEALLAADDPVTRINIENDLIRHLTLEDITGVEYWACLQEGKLEINYSIGRILDWFYSGTLKDIQKNNHQLRLYLKKADIFGNIGAIGACNYYLNKFSLEDEKFQKKLMEIQKTESDEGILNQLMQLVNEHDEASDNISLAGFLAAPVDIHKRDIKIMNGPTPEEYKEIIKAIRNTEDIAAIKRIFYYIRLHPVLGLVPDLFSLLDDDRILIEKRGIVLSVADNLAPIMESIYNYSFPKVEGRKKFDVIPWQKMWEENGKDYETWARIFFERKLASLAKSKTLEIEDINQITTSIHYGPLYQDKCLRALKKVKPIRDIRKLQVDPKLLVSTDLIYFDSFAFSYKELDNIPKLFTVDQPGRMLKFLEYKARDFEMIDKGTFYNNLFRSSWFLSYIGSGELPLQKAAEIKAILVAYFNENEYLSEFEEQVTQFNIAQLESLGKQLDEQLMASIDMNIDHASMVKIQASILARISYEDIPMVVALLPQLAPELQDPNRFFLVKDFGLPIFDLDSDPKRKALIDQHKNLSQIDFYRSFLRDFGVDFENKNQELDFQKIYNILSYDAAAPFVSSSGGKRDYYTYGIIKVLELHFGDRLGFHLKLNESQTFYDFSSSKRAAAWMQYLEQQSLVKPEGQLPPSFNLTRIEN